MGMQPGVLQIPTAQALFASVVDTGLRHNECLNSGLL